MTDIRPGSVIAAGWTIPDPDGDLGRRQHGEPAAQDAGCAAGQRRAAPSWSPTAPFPGIPRCSCSATPRRSSRTARLLPGICPVAIQMGEYTAGVIAGRPGPPAAPRLPLLGQGPARGDRPGPGGGRHLEAPLRRLPRLAHLDLRAHRLPHRLPNRVLVLIQWAWSYFTYGRGARLITEESRPREPRSASRGDPRRTP